MRSRLLMAASVSSVVLCNTACVSRPQTAHSLNQPAQSQPFDLHDFTGIWMQTPERPFKTYPLTPEYEAILKQRRDDEAAPPLITATQCSMRTISSLKMLR
jgi:hypothetical protein